MLITSGSDINNILSNSILKKDKLEEILIFLESSDNYDYYLDYILDIYYENILASHRFNKNHIENAKNMIKQCDNSVERIVNKLLYSLSFTQIIHNYELFDKHIQEKTKNTIKNNIEMLNRFFKYSIKSIGVIFNQDDIEEIIPYLKMTYDGSLSIFKNNIGSFDTRAEIFDEIINCEQITKSTKCAFLKNIVDYDCDFSEQAINKLFDLKDYSLDKLGSWKNTINISYILNCENDKIKKIIHDKLGNKIFLKLKRSYNDYIDYCKVYMNFLDDEEQNLLSLKLLGKLRRGTYTCDDLVLARGSIKHLTNPKAIKRLQKELEKLALN